MSIQLYSKKYLAEFVYGSTDGTVTTFAIISGVMGAGLSPAIVLILGISNVLADGFSMASSNYLSTKSGNMVDNEIRQKSPLKTAFITFVSFVAVGTVPLLPFVFAFFFPSFAQHQFNVSIITTAIAFLSIGAIRGLVSGEEKIKTSLETFLIGGLAAFIAFIVGYILRGFIV